MSGETKYFFRQSNIICRARKSDAWERNAFRGYEICIAMPPPPPELRHIFKQKTHNLVVFFARLDYNKANHLKL